MPFPTPRFDTESELRAGNVRHRQTRCLSIAGRWFADWKGKRKMRNIVFELAGGMACALFLAIPLAAANTTLTKSAAKTTEPPRSVWPAENLTGKITMVYPSRHLIVVNHLGVPFDMVVGRNTRIESGKQTLTLDQLSSDSQQRRGGPFRARTIR